MALHAAHLTQNMEFAQNSWPSILHPYAMIAISAVSDNSLRETKENMCAFLQNIFVRLRKDSAKGADCMNMTNKEYGRYVDSLAPKSKCVKNCFNAFWVGGLICT